MAVESCQWVYIRGPSSGPLLRVITGAFKTAPREPLHRLIAPIDIRARMLMKDSALRLYRLPRGSQLLKCLGGTWSSPREGPPSTLSLLVTDKSAPGSLPLPN
jgi:hypothetical protein